MFVKEYHVFVNELPLPLEAARVSRFPFNRNWPGFQRPLDQTEVTGFASFDLAEPSEIRVECDFDFREVVIRPLSLGITPRIDGRCVTFTLTRPCQTVVEFDGISGALHLFADPPEADPVPAENCLYFGPGEHDAGRIILQSGQTVYIDQGAVVYGEIYGCDVENVSILGKGILDHSKAEPEVMADGFIDPPRPSPIKIEYSKNVVIRNITVRDPFFLAVRPICCENVHIDGIKIIGNWRYNSDGIDLLNCRHALVENCFVRSFDDSFCIKGFASPYASGIYHNGEVYNCAEDIVFRNCVAFNDWGKALEVGIDLCAREIKNCRFEHCDVIHAIGPVMDVCNADYAHVHDIVFSDIRAEYGETTPKPVIQTSNDAVYDGFDTDFMPPLIHANVCFFAQYSSRGERGHIDNLRFENIRVTAPKMPPCEFDGFDEEHGLNHAVVSGLYLNGKAVTSPEEANFAIGDFARNVTLE